MTAVLPGKPQSRLQGLASCFWNNQHINAYISGSVFTVLNGLQTIIQTVYDDDKQPLDAIAIDEVTGKIATCTATEVRVYKPSGWSDDVLKWALQSSFAIRSPGNKVPCVLSWGSTEELLVAGKTLCLFGTKSQPICYWEEELSSPAMLASLSYDSAFVASTAHHDRLVKIWRRLTYGSNEEYFDLSYLQHPGAVTGLRWRKPYHIEQGPENILYASCLDNSVHIWNPSESVDGRQWQLWGKIDIGDTWQNEPRALEPWLVCIIDGREFTAAVERAVEDRMADDRSTDDVALDHLVAVANRNPEICFAMNSSGHLSAWGLENIGSCTANGPHILNIAQVKSQSLECLGGFIKFGSSPHMEIQAYCDRPSGNLHILLHSFDGRIGCFTATVADFFDPTINDTRLSLYAVWSGHTNPIKKIVRNFSGRAIVSRTGNNETIVWNHVSQNTETPTLGLTRCSIIAQKEHIYRICVLRKGRFVILLCQNNIVLWDCRSEIGSRLAQCSYYLQGKPLCLIILPRAHATDYTTAHIATIASNRQGVVWKVRLPRYFEDPLTVAGVDLSELCRFELPTTEDLHKILPVDPAGSIPATSAFLDVFARDVAISYTKSGRVEFWTARIDLHRSSVEWLSTCLTETGLSNLSLVSGSTLKKAALVDSSKSQVTIWDIGSSRLEFKEDYSTSDVIHDLDWTSTPDAQSILAVGFHSRVILIAQMRFDYLTKGPAWAPIREISIRELTPHPIGDSTWLGDGYLVIGAGNQLFTYDRCVKNADSLTVDLRLPHRDDGTWDLFEAVQRFNGPLPVFHPQFLSQCILSGKSALVRRIFVALHKVMKDITPGNTVDDYVGLNPNEFYSATAINQSKLRDMATSSFTDRKSYSEDDADIFTEHVAISMNDKLTRVRIPQLSRHEQIQLMDMIECVASIERQRRSIDENGARFMLFYRQHALRKGRTNEMHLSWREINWAYHSNSHDILLDFVSRQSHGGMDWDHARECGVFMWTTDTHHLRRQFEVIARNEYTKSETKNPVDCSLYYLALRKKAVLQGLWRIATWNKEQSATQRLLANNFDEPKWRRSALKNAFALLSKRRFEYAAAFFLLADRLEDATEVCLRHLKDVQLAIAICRVYEGDSGPVLEKLLREEVLQMAGQEGNRWLASWAFWMLGRKDMAVRALIMPVYTLLETPCSPDFSSRLFLTDDPALVVLYSQLRHQTLQTLRGASKVTPKVEWEFVLHSAKLYDRMGCDLLGLDLVRNWEFQRPGAVRLGGEVNPLKLLRQRSSLVVDDMSQTKLRIGATPMHQASQQSLVTPLRFQEPDAGSLLESFGL